MLVASLKLKIFWLKSLKKGGGGPFIVNFKGDFFSLILFRVRESEFF